MVPTLKRFQPSSVSEALTKSALSFGSLIFQLVAKASVTDVCFFTSGGGHLVDIIAVTSCNILTLTVGTVFKITAGIVEAPLADAMIMLAAEIVEVLLSGAGVVLFGTVSVVQDAVR